ncbi:MAG TPA: single-stranded-DNA-specific exonuclease RecJ [Thermoanaerobaculia bacterium]|nr:single-stranded-DNA-specific exonuclease RecJ [Thermoanaerobaculia bacterium]
MIYDEWIFPGDAAEIALPVHPILRNILATRGITTEDDYRRFVAPTLADLHDAAGIHGIGAACERIERAVRDRETILIYGDYDVDGVTSIGMLQTVLRLIGADADHVVPHRLVDGYGLKFEVLERVLAEKAVRLVITVDCGITSVEPVRRAIDRGIDVIITDHHLPPGVLPDAAAVLNPKQPGCAYPFKELAGVGVAFKLCCQLARRSGKKISTESLLKIAAIGTVADVAPLIGENRTIAWLGLHGLSDPRNRGLRALIRRLGMLGRPLRAVDVGFRIGPRINAAGRLASAETAIDLFAAQTDEIAWNLCAELDRMNAERQAVELEVRTAAEEQVAELLGCSVAEAPSNSATQQPSNRMLILAGSHWHKGVIGLAAGRIAQKYHRPTLVMSIDGDTAVGSARSIPTIDLHAQLESISDVFTHFGGHEFACGFSLPAARIPELRTRLAEVCDRLDANLFRRQARIDGALALAEIDRTFLEGHELLQPFGAGNPQPLFFTCGVRALARRPFGEDCLELTLEDGSGRATAVLWPSAKMLETHFSNGSRSDLLYQVEPDAYAASGARLTVVDARNSTDS